MWSWLWSGWNGVFNTATNDENIFSETNVKQYSPNLNDIIDGLMIKLESSAVIVIFDLTASYNLESMRTGKGKE